MAAWKATGLIPFDPTKVLSRLPNNASAVQEAQARENQAFDALVDAGSNQVEKATQAVKSTLRSSPQKRVLEVIEVLNANNAILSKVNADLVAATRTNKRQANGKRIITKARFLSQIDADKLRAEEKLKEEAAQAAKRAQGTKKKGQALKKAEMEAGKADRVAQRMEARSARETNAEQVRLAKIDARLFM